MKGAIVSESEQNPGNSRSHVVLTPEQLRARKRRNVAIGITIGLLAVLFYAVTIAKLGSGMFNRPL